MEEKEGGEEGSKEELGRRKRMLPLHEQNIFLLIVEA
jgi:hypothetical protein